MSYCRFGADSNVYMFPHIYGGIMCMGCNIVNGYESGTFDSYEEAIEHLNKHLEAGDKVPEYAFARLKAERDSSNVLKPYKKPDTT